MKNTLFHSALELTAGPLAMTFDPETAMLRYVRLGDIELVRGVFAAVRDQDWNTIPFSIDELRIDQTPDHFELSFLARCAQAGIEFDWRGTITGSPTGAVRYEFQGQAKSTFLRNRIGLCVLYPIKECVGRTCTIEHSDGSTTRSRFPMWISPDQPFKDVRSMRHEVARELDAKVTFDGEVFETEDQRNWTDASFKTYGTPLELPFPVEIQAGSHVDQSVTIEMVGDTSSTAGMSRLHSEPATEVGLVVDWDQALAMPAVGLSMATCGQQPTDAAIERLRKVRPAHLRVDIDLQRSDWAGELRRAIELASSINSKLEIASLIDDIDRPSWQQCLVEVGEMSPAIARWLVFHPTAKSTPDALAEAACSSLQKLSAELPVVVGTNAYFAELNRNRPAVPVGCQVSYSINPQVHAFDNLSLRETLEAQCWTVDSAHELFGVPVVISPITLRPRFNPNATSTSAAETTAEPETDVRQRSGFAAAWTVGVLAQLATHPDVASLTFYETFGPRGIMAASGEAYPVASVFEAVGDAESAVALTSTASRDVAAIGVRRANGERQLLLANLSNQPRTACVTDKVGEQLKFPLDAESVRVVQWESRE